MINWIKNKWATYKENKRVETYLAKHGFTHCCPSCNVWEHDGNIIYTEIYDRETDKRTCSNCGHVWRSLFCPAGHAVLEGWKWDGEKFVVGGGCE